MGIVAPVEAMDTNNGTFLTYTLSGTDAASFDIVRADRPVADQGRAGLRDEERATWSR